MAETRARHASRRTHPRVWAALLFTAAAGGGVVIFAAGYSLAPTTLSTVSTEATAARPRVTPTPLVVPPATSAPTGGPTAAARSLRAVRDLSAGDTLLYYPEPYGEGVPCTFIAFESPSPRFARADCGSGEVQVKVCDIASTTVYSRPGA